MSEFNPVLLTLPGLTPSLAVEVLPRGLTLHRVYVQVDGRTHDVVIGPESPQDHVTQKYTNTIVGRYANRIPVGTHILERHGITSTFTAQANENPRVSLHGGPVAYDAVPWTKLSENQSTLFSAKELSQITSLESSSFAIFQLESSDGDQGYPGKLILETLIALITPGEQPISYKKVGDEGIEFDVGSILIVYRAKLAKADKKGVTPINLTQHWGFNLDASLKEGPDTLSVKSHVLTIRSDRIAELGADSLSTGSFIPMAAGSPHAHAGKKIGDAFPENGYDDYYAFAPEVIAKIPSRYPLSTFGAELNIVGDLLRPSAEVARVGRGDRSVPLVELTAGKSGLKLLFDSNQHGVMFYSNNLTNASKGARKKIHGGSGISGHGDSYPQSTAAFLEFHNPLTAFLDPNNKDGEDTLLTSDEFYHNYVRCDIRFKEPRA